MNFYLFLKAYLFIYLFIYLFHLYICTFIHTSTYLLINLYIYLLVDCIFKFIYWFIDDFDFIHVCIYSFIYSFIHFLLIYCIIYWRSIRASYGLSGPDFVHHFHVENPHFREKWYVEYNNVLLNLFSQCNLWRNITFNSNRIFILRNTPRQFGIFIHNHTHYCFAWKHWLLNS